MKEGIKEMKYTVRWVASCVYKPNMSIVPHSHDFYQYLYVKKGSGELQTDGKRLTLEIGKIYVLPPFIQHSIESFDEGMTTYELKFHANRENDTALSETTVTIDLSGTHAESVFKGMFNETANMHPMYKEMLSLKLEELHLCMTRAAELDESKKKTSSYSQTFSDVIYYMERNYASEMSLKTLADIAHMEKIYFLKKFKAEVGTTPVNYLRRLRINQSKNLLINSDFNVTQIAEAVGFQSIHHFSNVFKKLVGISPSEYKEQNGK